MPGSPRNSSAPEHRSPRGGAPTVLSRAESIRGNFSYRSARGWMFPSREHRPATPAVSVTDGTTQGWVYQALAIAGCGGLSGYTAVGSLGEPSTGTSRRLRATCSSDSTSHRPTGPRKRQRHWRPTTWRRVKHPSATTCRRSTFTSSAGSTSAPTSARFARASCSSKQGPAPCSLRAGTATRSGRRSPGLPSHDRWRRLLHRSIYHTVAQGEGLAPAPRPPTPRHQDALAGTTDARSGRLSACTSRSRPPSTTAVPDLAMRSDRNSGSVRISHAYYPRRVSRGSRRRSRSPRSRG